MIERFFKRILCCVLCSGAVYMAMAQHIVTPLNADDVLDEAKWKGRWIGLDRLVEGEDLSDKTRVNARYLRTEFQVADKPVRQAKVYIAAVGYYELYVNGSRKGGDYVLTPVQTDTRKSIIYNAIDVTENLQQGKSCALGVILGNGRAVPMRYQKHYKCPFMGFPKCKG